MKTLKNKALLRILGAVKIKIPTVFLVLFAVSSAFSFIAQASDTIWPSRDRRDTIYPVPVVEQARERGNRNVENTSSGRKAKYHCYFLANLSELNGSTLCSNVTGRNDEDAVIYCYNRTTIGSQEGAILCSNVKSSEDTDAVINCYNRTSSAVIGKGAAATLCSNVKNTREANAVINCYNNSPVTHLPGATLCSKVKRE